MMRDRWVLCYLLFVMCQLPFYVSLGAGPVSYEIGMEDAERRLRDPSIETEVLEQCEQALTKAQSILDSLEVKLTRTARLDLARGVFAWKQGKTDEAVHFMESSRRQFVEFHGPDSFHAAAVDLRVAELLYFQHKYPSALLRFQRSGVRVAQYLGPGNSFLARMRFREVSALVALGRSKDAAKIARANLLHLKNTIDEQDDQFLQLTGGNLDLLSRQAFLMPPPEQGNWKAYLLLQKKSERDSRIQD